MNALSVQEDATFDLSNGRLITLRIALGALFGMVLSVAFGFQPFLDFMWGLVNPAGTDKNRDIATLSQQALMLLLPFVLGFSTSLVIMVLNRCVESVQTFFGKPPTQGGDAKRAPRQAARGGQHAD